MAASATPNESGLVDQLQNGGTNANTTSTPVYRECAPSGSRSRSCDNARARIDVVHRNGSTGWSDPALSKSWVSVPVPLRGFKPSSASDHQAVVQDYTGSTKRYFEFWDMRRRGRRWYASWGGAASYAEMKRTDGLLVWPTKPHQFGTSASGIAQVPGVILLRDLQRGVIDHPIHVAVKNACTTWKAPATRTDGRGQPNCIQYGAKFKLSRAIDVDAITSDSRWCAPSENRTNAEADALGWDRVTLRCPLPPLARMILKAAQGKWYIVATDQAGSGAPNEPGVTFDIESYDRPRTGSWRDVPPGNPYNRWFGCDGIQGTGQYEARRVNPGDWEQDCYPGTWAAWKPFPMRGWYEVH